MSTDTWRPGDKPGLEPLREPVDLQRANGEEHENGLQVILQRHKAAKDRIKELMRMLRRVEWPDDSSYGPMCHLCGAIESEGHAEGCELAALLEEGEK